MVEVYIEYSMKNELIKAFDKRQLLSYSSLKKDIFLGLNHYEYRSIKWSPFK